jgi:hypothetical protein
MGRQAQVSIKVHLRKRRQSMSPLPQAKSATPIKVSEMPTVMTMIVPSEELLTGLINALSITAPIMLVMRMVSGKAMRVDNPKEVSHVIISAPNTKNSPCAKQITRDTL